MRSKNVAPMIGFQLIMALVVAGAAQAKPDAVSAPPTVEAFMQGFTELKGFEAKFIETKTMSLLAVPLTTEGRLYFSAPGQLLRLVDKPQPTRVLVTPTSVTMKAAGQTQRLDLASQPEVRSLVSSLLSLLTGDLEALQATYDVAYEVDASGRWGLNLTPKSKRLSVLVERMRFEGRGRAVARIIVEEASGDRAVTEIVDAQPGRRFTAEERARLFEAS